MSACECANYHHGVSESSKLVDVCAKTEAGKRHCFQGPDCPSDMTSCAALVSTAPTPFASLATCKCDVFHGGLDEALSPLSYGCAKSEGGLRHCYRQNGDSCPSDTTPCSKMQSPSSPPSAMLPKSPPLPPPPLSPPLPLLAAQPGGPPPLPHAIHCACDRFHHGISEASTPAHHVCTKVEAGMRHCYVKNGPACPSDMDDCMYEPSESQGFQIANALGQQGVAKQAHVGSLGSIKQDQNRAEAGAGSASKVGLAGMGLGMLLFMGLLVRRRRSSTQPLISTEEDIDGDGPQEAIVISKCVELD